MSTDETLRPVLLVDESLTLLSSLFFSAPTDRRAAAAVAADPLRNLRDPPMTVKTHGNSWKSDVVSLQAWICVRDSLCSAGRSASIRWLSASSTHQCSALPSHLPLPLARVLSLAHNIRHDIAMVVGAGGSLALLGGRASWLRSPRA